MDKTKQSFRHQHRVLQRGHKPAILTHESSEHEKLVATLVKDGVSRKSIKAPYSSKFHEALAARQSVLPSTLWQQNAASLRSTNPLLLGLSPAASRAPLFPNAAALMALSGASGRLPSTLSLFEDQNKNLESLIAM